MSVPADETSPIGPATDLLYTDASTGGLLQRRVNVEAVGGPGAGPSATLSRGSLVVGSHAEAQLQLADPSVSRFHARLQLAEEGVRVVDLDSKNGSFVGPSRVRDIVLRLPAELRVGKTVLRLGAADAPLAAQGAAPQLGGLVGTSPGMRALCATLSRVAPTESTVLLEGESGTGKELCARAVHDASPRKSGPFVVLDCASLPDSLAEAELFGHTRGAFTDATSDRAGAFERASGGTLFLDELGELPLSLQPKLLRAIQQREVQRIGDTSPRPVDVRLVAATNRDLRQELAEGRFREDLYYRLAVVCVRLPPLRERPGDLPVLAAAFATELRGHLPAGALAAYQGYGWPGNVRELRNAVERILAIGAEADAPPQLRPPPLPSAVPAGVFDELPYKQAREKAIDGFERDYVAALLKRHDGNVRRAAEAAGIDRVYLHKLVRRHDLKGGE